MTNLISGKEALIALAYGNVVQGNIGHGWIDIDLNNDVLLNSFITERNRDGIIIKFRLKPRTIAINGIEVPAPFKPKVGEKYWFIAEYMSSGYSDTQIGKWRTEEEVKQVVAALR